MSLEDSVAPAEFRARWQAWYPDTAPHGYEMRASHPDRWLRIHSLPGSKRYPESDADRAILLERHNAVATEALHGAPSVLLGYDYYGVYQFPAHHLLRAWVVDAPPVLRIAPDDDEADATSVFEGRIDWVPGAMDELLLHVADDRIRLLLLNWDTGAVYAPYDGGADLFWPTPAECRIARQRFGAWLSPRVDGL